MTLRTRRLFVSTCLAAATVVAPLALSGCGSASPSASEAASTGTPGQTDAVAGVAPGYTVLIPATIKPGDPVPAPKGKVVLTMTGVSNPNVGKSLRFDLPTLEKLGTVRYSVFDRQAEGRDVEFSGPLLRTLLDVAGANGATLHTVALNDYSVDIPRTDATDLPVLLATRADGRRMSVAHYGPTRFIYPTKGYHLDKTKYDPRWIWQLAKIDVR